MSLALVTSALGKLADTKAKVVLLVRNHATLARQTERIGGFLQKHPEIRFDWLTYGTGIKALENSIADILDAEAKLRADLSDWVDRNFRSGAAGTVRIDLDTLGIRALSGLGSLPVEPLLRLGDGTAASLAGRIFGLQQKVHRALGALESLEKTHLLTLRKAREMLKAQGKDGVVRDLDGVIAQNEADSLTGMGADPSILILAGLGVWAGWTLWNWLKNRRTADA